MIWSKWFFFFSSRRRHTRCGRDWSSDVCSSDLGDRRGRRQRPPVPDRRGDRVLRGRRGADQRRQARPGQLRLRGGAPGGRHAARRGDRRRGGRRRGDLRRHRAGRAGRPSVRSGRPAGAAQPGRRPDRAHRGVAVRVVIAEDSVLLREGLTRLLSEAGFEVVAAVSDAEQLLRRVGADLPEVVVADVRMPPTHRDEGVRAALVIRQRWPQTAVLLLSQYVEERYATELLAGDTRGVGYLLKDRVADVDEFVEALRRVGGGGTALDPEVVTQLLARSRRRHPLQGLTQ